MVATMSASRVEQVIAVLSRTCARGGIDLAAACRAGAYNARVAEEYRVPDFGEPRSLVVILANSRALWAPFIAAWKANALAGDADPLDGYVEELVGRAVSELQLRTEVRFAHEAPPRRVAIQELARLAGLAALSPAHLSAHPDFGPWIGLRAAVVVDCLGPETTPIEMPCAACEAPCERVLEQVLEAGADSERDWRQWVAIRDACPWGVEHRYGDDQLRYHYTKDPSRLR